MSEQNTPLTATVTSSSTEAGALGAELSLPEAQRYEAVTVLGAGGMGEVHLVADRRLGREVAQKQLRPELGRAVDQERFLREVRVQGQLEHPSVVPVYDLGLIDGAPYFTMKRIRGRTLSAVLKLLKEGDPETLARFTRYRLLSIFNTLCLCIDSAHSSGVLHRDLKPSNVMLGNFGEVYVLDWGLARLRNSTEPSTSQPQVMVDSALGSTELGLAIGTPGYMSPEQADGLPDLDERTDIYALGVMLYEMLHLVPLHDAATPLGRLESTRRRQLPKGGDPGVPRALELIWRKACAPLRDDRHRSARELADEVERFLDSERDTNRRQELAKAQLQIAGRAATDSEEGRGRALQALGKALAFDPTNAEALSRLSELLAHVPTHVPQAARPQLKAYELERARGMLLSTAVRFALWSLAAGVAGLMVGTKSFSNQVINVVVMAVAAGLAFLAGRSKSPLRWQLPIAMLGAVSLAAFTYWLGPFLLVPSLAATHVMLSSANLPKAQRRWVMVVTLLSVVVPALVLPTEHYARIADGGVYLTTRTFRFDTPGALWVLIIFSLIPVATPSEMIGRLRDRFAAVERLVVSQVAALRQLIPREEEVSLKSRRDEARSELE